jgi:transposase
MVSGYGKSGFLDRIELTFDGSAFETLLAPIHASARGAPGYPPLTMFRIVLLRQRHTLSDPAAEEAVRDRLSFRRFCGLPLDMETPDHASIWRFLTLTGKGEQPYIANPPSMIKAWPVAKALSSEAR